MADAGAVDLYQPTRTPMRKFRRDHDSGRMPFKTRRDAAP
ncbi:hypothetical protein BSU04_10200 [Caballeronia sordidicola]|uniref:Uncharacterized protein n=1 Tax=Caballeronia sordidicola TaxID=196367 RepID=A0A226X5K4_CABSO|nr:hypothetical protein BSU04_10200 [Caballeronia sordidicola]